MYGYNPYQNFYQAQNTGTDDRIWVQNKGAAEAYLMAPNSFVRLWDANQPVFYEKRSDGAGRPLPLEAYKYTKETPPDASVTDKGTINYQEQINAILGRLDALERGRNESDAKSNDDDSKV